MTTFSFQFSRHDSHAKNELHYLCWIRAVSNLHCLHDNFGCLGQLVDLSMPCLTNITSASSHWGHVNGKDNLSLFEPACTCSEPVIVTAPHSPVHTAQRQGPSMYDVFVQACHQAAISFCGVGTGTPPWVCATPWRMTLHAPWAAGHLGSNSVSSLSSR